MASRPFATAVAAVFLALAVSASVAAESDEAASWLVVMKGEVIAITDGQTIAADPKAVAFTDRPGRTARFVDVPAFVATGWAVDGNLQQEAPNASLVDATKGTIGVITIDAAAWNDGTLVITFATLEGNLPVTGDTIALTIDNLASGGSTQFFLPPAAP